MSVPKWLEEQRNSEQSNEFYNNRNFPTTIEGDNLQKFVNTNNTLHENINNRCYELTSSQQECNLMKTFTEYHAKSFDREDWMMIVWEITTKFQIAIINIKEQIFAKTFSSFSRADIQNVLNLNGYRISFTIDDAEGMFSSEQPKLLLLCIHNSMKMGNCQTFQSNAQKIQIQQSLHARPSYLQSCPYCNKINDPMKSNIGLLESLLNEKRRDENIKSIARHVLPENRNSVLCSLSLLGLNEAVIKALLLREANGHRTLMMNIFERENGTLQSYLEKLQLKHSNINDTTSEDYALSLHQIMVAKRW